MKPLTLEENHVEKILVLQNGYTNKTKIKSEITFNTCGFDSIMQIYVALDLDYNVFDVYNDCDFTKLMNAIKLSTKYIKKKVYVSRNNLLFDLYDNSPSLPKSFVFPDNQKIKQLNCYCGVSDLFHNLCLQNNILNSIAVIRECEECKTKSIRLNPFVLVDLQKLNFEHIQSVILTQQKQKICKCGKLLQIRIKYNDTVLIEVGKTDVSRSVNFDSIEKKIVLGDENYSLKGIIEHTGAHFKSYILRKNGCWECYDDLYGHKQTGFPAKMNVACLFFVKGIKLFKQNTLPIFSILSQTRMSQAHMNGRP